jgi:biotin carboxylase
MNFHKPLSKLKLLVLGANPETVPLIQTAQKMGTYVIVTDNNPVAYAKQFADKKVDIDGMDVPGLVTLAREEKVDGVIVGVADRLITPYQQICEILELPCYATREQCRVLTDKLIFNQKCKEHDISTIPSFDLPQNPTEKDLEKLVYPVFVKPVDANSGKGMSICYKKEEVIHSIDNAIKHSITKRYLIERCMNTDDMFVYFTIKDGATWVSATADRFTSREQSGLSRVCLGNSYPSKHTELYFSTVHDQFVKLFSSLKLRNCIFMTAAFVENDTLHFYDPGFRLQGEAPDILIESINGFDQKAMLIRFALTGRMGQANLAKLNDCRFQGRHAATVWLLAKEGTIGQIEGLEEITSYHEVIKIAQRLYPGDKVSSMMVGTEAQVIARIYIAGSTKEQVKKAIKLVQKKTKVYDIKGKPMLLNGFDPDII